MKGMRHVRNLAWQVGQCVVSSAKGHQRAKQPAYLVADLKGMHHVGNLAWQVGQCVVSSAKGQQRAKQPAYASCRPAASWKLLVHVA